MLILRVCEKFKLSIETHVDVVIEKDMKRGNPDTGAFPGRIDTFKVTRYDEESNKWVDDDAKNAYDKMNSLRINPPEELQHLFEDEIYDYMIGESPSSYVGGLGTGPKLRPLFWSGHT
ncbi:hypothetical protein JRO89_XS07G0186100 [Xanthoceras sorbifolium]|uniref:Uncharacterized protein n=1 Tax=Xanthoceras sorbifolium TaxID=99658 RepID=A0ABQ8HUF5_9ROSI|nr:hypothetical protein JRO89_XS07G0186100 [Xanthoceras sorbifolium]